MKKQLALLTALLIALTLSPFSGSAESAAKNVSLDTVFAEGGTLRLVPADLPGKPGDEWIPVDLSPDGKTVLWRNNNNLALSRPGETIPVTFTAERGVGDPYEKARKINISLNRFPAWEGLSWSADGRYVALSDLETARQFASSPYVPDAQVLDTESGELYLVDSYNPNLLKGDAGTVLLNRVDRKGQYLYYLVQEYLFSNQEDHPFTNILRFCRCPAEGGSREILCETILDENKPYYVYYHSTLYEAADGSWLLTGCTADPDNKGREQLAIVRFSPSGDGWTQEIFSLHIPFRILQFYMPFEFADSGYGLCALFGNETSGGIFYNSEKYETSILSGMARHAALLRIKPGNSMPCDVWYLMRSDDTVKLVSGEDFLYRLKAETGLISPDDEQAQSEEAREVYEKSDAKTYDLEIHQITLAEQSLLRPTCVCISPDGYYALVNAGIDGQYRLYMVDIRAMEILPVEAPEGIGSSSLSGSVLGKGYMPGMIWNEGGTLLIRNSENTAETVVQSFRLAVD